MWSTNAKMTHKLEFSGKLSVKGFLWKIKGNIYIYIYIYIVCIYLFFQHHCIWPKMSKKKSSHPVNLQCSPSRLTIIEWVCSLARMDAGREWHLEWLPYTHTNPISREKLPEIICWTLHYNWEIKLTVQLWAFISFSSDDNRGADSI